MDSCVPKQFKFDFEVAFTSAFLIGRFMRLHPEFYSSVLDSSLKDFVDSFVKLNSSYDD